MTARNENHMSRSDKIALYLGLPAEPAIATATVDIQIEHALIEAGGLYRNAGTRMFGHLQSRKRLALLAAAAILIAALSIACVWSGLAGRIIQGIGDAFAPKKHSFSKVAPPGKKLAEPKDEVVTETESPEKIIFLSKRDADPNDKTHAGAIYSMNPDGTEQSALTDTGCNTPAISPDGRQIAYSFDNSIWVMNIDGSEKYELVHGELLRGDVGGYYYPEWSPDGTKICFVEPQMHPRLYVYDMLLGQLHKDIGPREGVYKTEWMPDSREITYQKWNKEMNTYVIESVDYDGSNMRALYADVGVDYGGLIFSADGVSFVLGRGDRKEAWGSGFTLLAGDYPSMQTREVGKIPHAPPEHLLKNGVTIIRSGDGPTYEVSAVDTKLGERWTLYTGNNLTGEFMANPSTHNGEPFYFTRGSLSSESSNIYRIDMNGTLTQLTDSGKDFSPVWR